MKRLFLVVAMALAAPVAAQQYAHPVIPPLKYNDVMTAVVFRDLETLKELLALGEWPDKADSQGRPPLLVALELGYREIADALLKAGANPYWSLVRARQMHTDEPVIARLEQYTESASAGPTGAPPY
jgi:ankyrin repeat protein